jgi:hypothetical protein
MEPRERPHPLPDPSSSAPRPKTQNNPSKTNPSLIPPHGTKPKTGKTIAQKSQAQVSFSLVDAGSGAYDLYYKTAYQGTAIYVYMYMYR